MAVSSPPCQASRPGETEEAAVEDGRVGSPSRTRNGGSEAVNGAEDPEGALCSFDTRLGLEALASEQGVEPADDFDALLGDFWPEVEDADELVTALRIW